MKRCFLISFILLLFISCKKEPLVLLSSQEIVAPMEGISTSLTVTTNHSWSVTSPDWCIVSPNSGGEGEVSVTISIAENTTYDPRSGNITFTSEGVSSSVFVAQEEASGLIAPSNSFELSSEAQDISVEVQANVEYDVTVNAEWISQEGTKALSSKIYNFRINNNETYDSREGTITIKEKGGNLTQTIKVRQAQKGAIILSAKEYSLTSDAQSLDVKLQTSIDLEIIIPDTAKNWISYNTTKALIDKTIILDIAENNDYDSRTSEVIIKQKDNPLADTITIKQAQKDAILLAQKEYNVNSDACILEVELQSNVELEVEFLDSANTWISTIETKALTDRILSFDIKANEDYDSRTGKVVIKMNDSSLSDTLYIIQAQKDVIILVEDEYYLTSEAQSLEVNLQANIVFDIIIPEVDKNWISYNTTKTPTDKTIIFDISENTDYGSRISEIVFKQKDNYIADTIVITQDSKYVVLPKGREFNRIVDEFIRNNAGITGIQFISNSNIITDDFLVENKIYLLKNENILEIHTSEEQFIANRDCSSMFTGIRLDPFEKTSFSSIEYINFGQSFITEITIDMNDMFYRCSTLREVDLSSFNTSRVEDMSHMFSECSSLKGVDLSSFNTSRVEDMSHMFSECSSLKGVDLSSFNTSFVSDMSGMFYMCSSLTVLDIRNFNTENVVNMSNLFNRCSSLKYLDLSNFNTSNVNNMNGLFFLCSSLKSLDLRNFDTSRVTDMSGMFSYCYDIRSINLSSFDTENVIKMDFMFNDCSVLKSLDLKGFNTSNVEDMTCMFNNCSSLTSLDLSSFNTENVTNLGGMFYNCSSLTSINLSMFNTDKVKSMGGMFYNCSSLVSLDVSNFNTKSIDDDGIYGMQNMFANCSSLTSLDLSNFNTENVTNLEGMFYNCLSLTSLDLSNFNTENVTNLKGMFYNCSSLISIDLSKFSFRAKPAIHNIFYNVGSNAVKRPIPVYVSAYQKEYIESQNNSAIDDTYAILTLIDEINGVEVPDMGNHGDEEWL